MEIRTVEQVAEVRAMVLAAAGEASATLSRLGQELGGLELLERIRFAEIGHHPVEAHPLNLVEQVNQSFTVLASLAGVELLLGKYPEQIPLVLNLGTQAGPDISTADGFLAAETFTAVRPANNQKLRRDIEKVSRSAAERRYVFFYCPGEHVAPPWLAHSEAGVEVEVVPLSRAQLLP